MNSDATENDRERTPKFQGVLRSMDKQPTQLRHHCDRRRWTRTWQGKIILHTAKLPYRRYVSELHKLLGSDLLFYFPSYRALNCEGSRDVTMPRLLHTDALDPDKLVPIFARNSEGPRGHAFLHEISHKEISP